jgi:trimeric autotransporter adhesin
LKASKLKVKQELGDKLAPIFNGTHAVIDQQRKANEMKHARPTMTLGKKALLTALICGAFSRAQALPFGEQVLAGLVDFSRDGRTLNIQQSSQKSIVNWQSFGIAVNESVKLNQPNQGVALFRVVGNDPSAIYGNLSATGQLFLSNPNGVLFGAGAQVDVGSLVVTTMRIQDNDFLNGHYHFFTNPNDATNTGVVNQGVIHAADGGYLVLLGNIVENSGVLTANRGSVALGSAQTAVLDVYGDGLVRVKLDGDALNAAIKQTGNITADGGAIQLATKARSAAINADGVIQANSLVERNGVIRLEGGKNAKVSVNGTLNAVGNKSGTAGGNIEVTGEQVALFKQANLDASGEAGGGKVLVGGDYQGKNTQVFNARTTYVDKDAKINVDAILHGNGGKVVVWADDTTRFYGNITAKGGASAGNGGLVEVSGQQVLDFIGGVDVTAVHGLGGFVLLDPQDIVLNTTTQTSPPNNVNGTADIAFADAPAAGATTIQISDITGYSELFLQATRDISINNAITMAVNNSIRLEAGRNISIAASANIAVSGSGNVNFKADANADGIGNLAIAANISSQAGGINLSAANITRSAGNIASTGGANANAGNISITSTGTTNLGAATITANGGGASAGNAGRNGGAITINTAGYNGTGTISASGSNGNGANTSGGNAGSVSITSSNGISATAATAINANGGNAGTGNGNSGSAGVINLTNNTAGNITTGAINSRVGVAVGAGTGGAAGSINVANNASGILTTGAITSSGNNNSNGNGGNIQLSTTIGNITTGALTSSGGTVLTGNAGRNAGFVTINSGGSFTGTTITANGSAGLGTNQSGGNAANITINANTGVTATAMSATGGNATATNGNGAAAGNIALTNNTSGNISTTTITARNGNAAGTGLGGAAGAINVTNNAASGTITTGNLSTQGGTFGNGGSIAINGQNNVTAGTVITSGGTTLTGNAGRNAGSATINASGNIVVGAISATGTAGLGTNQNGGTGANVTLNSGNSNTITMSNIATTGGGRTGAGTGGAAGNMTVLDNALLSANTTIDTTGGSGVGLGGLIHFGGTINSTGANRTLTINNNSLVANSTLLSGAIGNTLALASITTNATGNTSINGGSVTTTGVQTYNDAVNTSGDTTFTTSNSNVNFNSAIAAAGNTVIAAGTGAVTATNAANNFNNLAITAGSANIRDSGAIVLGNTNITGNYTLQSGASITQSAPISVAGITTLNSGSLADITLANSANNFNSVAVTAGRDVNIQDVNALTINASSLRTLDARALNGNLTLAGSITATGTSPATSISLSASQNFINAGNFNLTPGAGKRWLVYSNNQATDTRGALLTSAYDFKQYNATIGNPILGTNDGFIYSTAPSITGVLGGTASKVYNANAAAPITSLTLSQSGAINADTVLLSGLTSATFDNKNVGVNKLVTSNSGINIVSATSAEGKPVFGYQLSSTSATGNVGSITQATLNLNAVTDSRTYNALTNSSGTVTSTGLQGSDTVTGLTQAFDSKNAGTRTLSVNTGYSVNDGNGGNNYLVTTNTATGSITQATLNLNAVSDSRTYNALTNSSGTVTSTGLQGSDTVTGLTQVFDSKNAGTRTLSVNTGYTVNDGNGGNNYLVTTNTAAGSITQATLSVTGQTATNKIYDGNTNATLAGGTLIGVLSGESVLLNNGTANFSDQNVGVAKAITVTGTSISGGDAANYVVSNPIGIIADITPRPIVVSANAGQGKVLGAPEPLPYLYTVSGAGLVAGDALTGALSRIAGEGVGSYAINQGSLTASSNYQLSFLGNNFSISQAVNANPRASAGLVDLNPAFGTYTSQPIFVLNAGFTAAGNDTNTNTCDNGLEPLAKDKNAALVLNFGLKLPSGVEAACVGSLK